MKGTHVVLGIAAALLALGGAWILTDVERGAEQIPDDGDQQASEAEPTTLASAPESERRVTSSTAEPVEVPSAPDGAQASTSEGEEEAVAWSGLVDGRVEDEHGGPIVGASVSVRDHGLVATTDEDGAFEAALELPEIRAPWGVQRRYDFEVHAAGFASADRSLELRDGGVAHLGTIRLLPGGEVRGRVLRQDRTPVAGALVGWRPASRRNDATTLEEGMVQRWPTEPPNVRSGEDGGFVLPGVPVGEGFLIAWGRAGQALGELFSVRRDSIAEQVLVITPGERVPVSIAGTVLDPSRAPAAGVRVVVRLWDDARGSPQPWRYSSGETDERGAFAIEFETPEEGSRFALTAEDPRQRGYPATLGGVDPAEGPFELVLEPADRIEIRQVDGQGRPVPWGHVRFEADGDDPSWVRGTSPLGEPGAARFLRPRSRFSVVSMAPGYVTGTVGPFDPGSVPDPLVLTMLPGQFVGGRVVAAGEPVANARVGLMRTWDPRDLKRSTALAPLDRPFWVHGGSPQTPGDATTDAEGRFRITLHRAGWTALVVEAAGYPRTVFGPWEWSLDGVDGLELVLQPAGAIEGTVLLPAGAPPEGRLVGAAAGWSLAHTAVVASDGSFRIEGLSPGRYQLRPCRPPAASVQTFSVFHGDFDAPASIEWDCEVLPGRDTSFVLDLRDEEAFVLQGRLALPEGAGPWEARLFDPPFELARASVAQDGTFELRLSTGGSLVLQVQSEESRGSSHFTQPLELHPGVNEWEPSVQWGVLEASGPGEEATFAYRAVRPGDLVFVTVRGRSPRDTHVRLPVPAGEGQLDLLHEFEQETGNRQRREVRVAPGETVVVDFDQER